MLVRNKHAGGTLKFQIIMIAPVQVGLVFSEIPRRQDEPSSTHIDELVNAANATLRRQLQAWMEADKLPSEEEIATFTHVLADQLRVDFSLPLAKWKLTGIKLDHRDMCPEVLNNISEPYRASA
jgi:hypothetical protein